LRPIPRIVLDTSTLVSAVLRPGSVPEQAVLKALQWGELCANVEALDELAEVLERGKFDRHRSIELRRQFAAAMRRTFFEVSRFEAAALIPACRDPKDDKFLALVLAAEVDVQVSSDDALPVLNPWRGIPTVTPAEFMTILGR